MSLNVFCLKIGSSPVLASEDVDLIASPTGLEPLKK
jgi:hypothetical protein